ncbi:hypothetical protein BESB_058290 [Besnoitia besnoiti]|uniref:Uncharacterized protein n=1 Tax=Besnoitia besnoiti TaxID=94643 RepID=A0A2A9MHR9_BESBE|nr:hypothetical protein BESB_058290 [Besnoitia besnoiti]PFH34942.1 hypothetical protein BESB_058290 [Besnoitia besnoiti]
MGASLSTERRTQLLSAVTVATAAAAVWWLTSRDGWTAKAGGQSGSCEISEKETEAAMKEICEEFHAVFTELAQVSRSVISAMQDQGFQKPVPREQVEAMLMQQMFRERLNAAESAVLARRRLSKESLERACGAYREKNDTIGLYLDGLKAMYRDAVDGVLPLLPGATLPEGLTEDNILVVLEQIHKAKHARFKEVLGNTDSESLSPASPLTRQLQECNRKAEEEVLAKGEHARLSSKMLLHAVAVFSRRPQFKLKKQLLDEMHTETIMGLMSKRKKTGVAPPKAAADTCIVAALHPKVEETNSEELLLRLQSCADSGAGVVCLVVRGEEGNHEEVQLGVAADTTEAKEIPHSRGGILSLRQLDEFCRAVDDMDHPDISFVYVVHPEARRVETDEIKTAAARAEEDGAAYLFFKGSALHTAAATLQDLVQAVRLEQKIGSAGRPREATKDEEGGGDGSHSAPGDTSGESALPTTQGVSSNSGDAEEALPSVDSPGASCPASEGIHIDGVALDGGATGAGEKKASAGLGSMAPQGS